MEEFMLYVHLRLNSFIRAYECAAAAADAISFHIHHLPYHLYHSARRCGSRNRAFGLHDPLDMHCGLDSFHRAYGRASAAPLTAVVPPADYIGHLPDGELMIVV